MNVPDEDHTILEDFIQEILEMVQREAPFIRPLVEQSDREDILPRITTSCFRLFHSIKGTGGFLRLEHLLGLADAMEYLLDRVRSGVQSFTPQHISLLAESCQFLQQGLPIVLVEKSDDRLAHSARALTAAIFQSTKTDGEDSWARRAGTPESSEIGDALVAETEHLLTTAEQEFVLWDFVAFDHQRVEALCRLLHRLQQNFTLWGLKDLKRLCLALELTLNRYLQGDLFQTEYPERVFLRSVDAVRDTVTRFNRFHEATVTGLEYHLSDLQGLVRKPIGTLLVEAGLVAPQAIEHALEVQKSSRDATPRRLGEVLVGMGKVTSDQVEQILQEQHSTRTRAMQAETKPATACRPMAQTSFTQLASGEEWFDSGKFARMIELIEHLATECKPADGAAPVLTELQELAKSCKEIVLSSFFSWLRRVVHDLAVHHDKRVNFVIEGIDALLNQRTKALLADPLFHLLRNGVEHGLETVEERVHTGKRKSGKLTLLAL